MLSITHIGRSGRVVKAIDSKGIKELTRLHPNSDINSVRGRRFESCGRRHRFAIFAHEVGQGRSQLVELSLDNATPSFLQ